MGWSSAVKAPPPSVFSIPDFDTEVIDWSRLVVIDFESFYDADYTLKKLSTSEYIRDERFEATMMYIKVGNKPGKVVPGPRIAAVLRSIPWETHSLLCHHTQFDGFIMSHHYGVHPRRLYCTLSMARGLHSNDIGAGLEEVAVFYGKGEKVKGSLEAMKGKRYKDLVREKLWDMGSSYCANDGELTLEIFKEMVVKMPVDEMDIIDHTIRMFTSPVLRVDLPRVEKELEKELLEKEALLLSVHGNDMQQSKRLKEITADTKLRAKKVFAGWTPKEILLEEARKQIASNEVFADMLRAEGVEPPMKISPAYFKHKREEDKWAYAFAKTDLRFIELKEHRSKRVRELVELRLMVKSTINETRAERFLKAGSNGWCLPVYLRYFGAHTGRWSAGNKMNMQNLPRGGELRKSLLAPEGHVLVVADSGQIEARVNAWLSGQDDLVHAFRVADRWDKSRGVARGDDRDAYCKFADTVYGREITTDDKLERFVGKVCVLGLGYQMGAQRLQNTLALGTMGPPVFLDLETCQRIVSLYRLKNKRIRDFWARCEQIIADMAAGRTGAYKCISWSKETIYLPNGMTLKYPKLRRKNYLENLARRMKDEPVEDEDGWVYDRKGEPTNIYGGLLCENIVQALARIIIGKQLLMIGKKYRPVTTTHDEVVALAKKTAGQAAYDFMFKCMTTPLEWCPDIPLSAEGGFAVEYSK